RRLAVCDGLDRAVGVHRREKLRERLTHLRLVVGDQHTANVALASPQHRRCACLTVESAPGRFVNRPGCARSRAGQRHGLPGRKTPGSAGSYTTFRGGAPLATTGRPTTVRGSYDRRPNGRGSPAGGERGGRPGREPEADAARAQ